MTRPDSPCVGVCTTLYDVHCRGCGRHFLEVANWNQKTEDEKTVIWDRVAADGFPKRNFTKQ